MTDHIIEFPQGIVRKSAARLAAVQALYGWQLAGNAQDITKLGDDMVSYYGEQEGVDIDKAFLNKLLATIIENQEIIDTRIKDNLSTDWPFARMDAVLIAILRASIGELLYFPNTPKSTIINEYIEITKAFFEEKESGFINGLLDTVAKSLA